jgi:hypothetical protein
MTFPTPTTRTLHGWMKTKTRTRTREIMAGMKISI